MTKTILSLLSNVLILAANIGTGVLVARMLGPENRGLLATAVSMCLLIAQSTSWSINDLLARHLSAARGEGESSGGSGVLNLTGPHVMLVALSTCLGVVLLAVIGAAPLILLPEAAGLILSGLILLVPLTHFSLTLLGVLQSADRWIGWNIARIAPHVAYLLFLLLLPDPASMTAIAQAFTLSYAVTCLMAWLAMRGLKTVRLGTSLSEIRSTAGAAANMQASRILQMMRQHLDRILIPLVFGAATLGYYIAAMTLVMPVYAAATTITSIYIPRITREVTGSPQRRRRTFFELAGLIVFGLAACFVYAMVAPALVTFFFGPAFAPAETMLPATVAIIAGYGTAKLLESYLIALDHTRPLILTETLPMLAILSGLVLFAGAFEGFLLFVAGAAWLVVLVYAGYLWVVLRGQILGSDT